MFHVCCCGRLCSCFTLPSAEMLPVERSVTDWESPPVRRVFYRLRSLYKTFSFLTACRNEIGKLWHCSKEGARITRLLCEISILNSAWLMNFEKWRIPPPPPLVTWPVVGLTWSVAGHFGGPPRGTRHLWPATRGRGMGLGFPLAGFPQTQRNSFWLVLLNYMTSRLCSWCYILLLTQRFFWC